MTKKTTSKNDDLQLDAEHCVVVHADKAEQWAGAVTLGGKRGVEKKYNIKLLQQDYEEIKKVAKNEGRSASYFVSFLIYDLIVRSLRDTSEASPDALLLIASTADQSVEYDISGTPWLYDFMKSHVEEIVAEVTKSREANLEPLMQLLDTYANENSHLHQVVKLMIKS